MFKEVNVKHDKGDIILTLSLENEKKLKKRIEYKRYGLDKWLLD